MPYMTRIPADLRKFGLPVEVIPGWETRGSSSFAPAGVVDHWTAGPRGTTGRPSLNVVTFGRAGLAGPLCNVYFDRRGICVVVAAGRANHAGVGGYRGLVGNSSVYGIEAECGGDGDWTPEQRRNYPRLNAALLSGIGRDASWCFGHNDWAPDRKIDIRDIIRSVQAETAVILKNPVPKPQPTPEPEDYDMPRFITDGGPWWLYDGFRRRYVRPGENQQLADLGLVKSATDIKKISPADLARIPQDPIDPVDETKLAEELARLAKPADA